MTGVLSSSSRNSAGRSSSASMTSSSNSLGGSSGGGSAANASLRSTSRRNSGSGISRPISATVTQAVTSTIATAPARRDSRPPSTENEGIARGTYDALMRGELDVVEELLAPEVTWQWWEPGPWDCHNRDEVVAVIRERAGQRAIGDLIEVSEVVPGKVLIVSGRR